MSSAKLVVAGLLHREEEGEFQVLICQRSPHGTMPLKWEFPGGKVEPDEDPRQALKRELREELDLESEIGRKLAVISYEYKNGFFVELVFFAVDGFEGEMKNQVFADVRWETLQNLATYDFLEADVVFIRDLAAGLVSLA